MKLKKFALRGMIILAAVIALCVLFSGTFRSLTTPKVKLVPPKTGKLETITKLTGMVTFPEEEEMNMKISDGLSLTVTRVYVVPGQEVRKGDRLMNAVVTNADKDLADLQTKYDTARNTLDNWNRKNGDLENLIALRNRWCSWSGLHLMISPSIPFNSLITNSSPLP